MKQYLELLDRVLKEGITTKEYTLEESKLFVLKQEISFTISLEEMRSFISKESKQVTERKDPDCEPSTVSPREDKAYMEEQQHKKGDKKVKRKTPLQRRMQRPRATLTYNLLKTGGDKEKLREEYERRMGNFLSYLDEADCIDEKEEEAWMKLFSGEEVDVKVKIHWSGTTGSLAYLLKLMKKEKLFSTPKMWSFWDWVTKRFVLANEEPAPASLRTYNIPTNDTLRKKIRKAVDALVYR